MSGIRLGLVWLRIGIDFEGKFDGTHFTFLFKSCLGIGVFIRGLSHRPLMAPSIGISGCNRLNSGGPTFIYRHNP